MRPDNTEPAGVEPAAPRSHRRLTAGLLGVAALLTGTGLVLGFRGYNADPDIGIAACEGLRDGYGGPHHVTVLGWHQRADAERERFAGSRYGDIRDAGTQFVDSQVDAHDDLNARDPGDLDFGPLVDDLRAGYAGLPGACAAHGVAIPVSPPFPWIPVYI